MMMPDREPSRINHDYSVVSFNSCGINSDHQQLEIQLFLRYTIPMILILQEPKLKHTKQPPNYTNYNTIYFPHPQKPTGILFYIHKSVVAHKLDIPYSDPYNKERTTLCAFVEVHLPHFIKPLIVAGVYLTRGSHAVEIQHMVSQFKAQARRGHLLAMGDFNSRHKSWDSEIAYNGVGHDYNGKLLYRYSNGGNDPLTLLNIIHCKFKPTHISHVVDSVIDLAFTSSSNTVVGMEVLYDTHISSDHYPIKVSLDTSSIPRTTREAENCASGYRLAWDIENANWPLYKTTLDTLLLPWISKYTEWKEQHTNPSTTTQIDIDECWNQLHKIILSTASLCVGQRKITYTSKKWWNPTILQLLRKYRRLERAYHHLHSRRRNTSPTILEPLRIQRNKAKYGFRIAVRQAKLDADNKATESIESNNKKVAWSQLKRLVKHTHNPMGTFRDSRNNTPKDRQESINNLSHCFAQTARVPMDRSFDSNHHKLVEEDTTNGLHNDGNHISLTSSIKDLPFSFQELTLACCKAPIHTSLGADEISPHFLRQGGLTLNTALHLLFSISYGHGRIPTPLKHAKVAPIYKQTGDIDDANNYRPISITSIVMRLWERLIKPTLLEGMKCFNIPSPHQFGFTKDRSTYDAIFHLLSSIADAFDDSGNCPAKDNYVPTIFIDIAKAYDKVWIPGLLYKLKQLNLDPHLYHFLKAFLTGRTFQVVHSGYISILQILEAGVPQGSVLAVFLFLIYIHGITENIHPRTQIKLFADDIAIHPMGKPSCGPTSMIHLQSTLNSITKFARKWKITFSIKKTNVMFFKPCLAANTPQRVPSYPARTQTLVLTGFRIQPTLLYTYLGITLDQYLTMLPHQQNIIATTTKTSFMISRLIKRDRPPSFPVIRQLVSTILIPKIMYGSPFFHIENKCSKTTRNKALRVNSEARLGNTINMYRQIKNIILRPLLRALGLPFRSHHNSVYIESRLLPLEFLQAKLAAAYAHRLLSMDASSENKASTLMKKYVLEAQEDKRQQNLELQNQNRNENNKDETDEKKEENMSEEKNEDENQQPQNSPPRQQQRCLPRPKRKQKHKSRLRRKTKPNKPNKVNKGGSNRSNTYQPRITHDPNIHPFHRLIRVCTKVPELIPTNDTFASSAYVPHADTAWEASYKEWYEQRADHSLPPMYSLQTPTRKTLPEYTLHDDPSTAAKRARLRFGRALIAFCWVHCGNKTANPECSHCRDEGIFPRPQETVPHVIEHCPRYQTQRDICTAQLQHISPTIEFNTTTILSPQNQPQHTRYLKQIFHISGIFIKAIHRIRKF
jgi:endonuclease/exonuclease/phosphatase family metal-dependent hydrolase